MVYIFLADGFEEIEALAPLDLLRRAGIECKTVGIGKPCITGAHGISIKADILDTEFSGENMQMIMLPGGMPGTKNLDSSPVVQGAIELAQKRNAYIAAICAAPMILGKKGILNGKEAICFPGFEEYLVGATLSQKRVVRDGKIITAAGAGVAVPFGLEIVSALCGKEKADALSKAILFS